MSFILAGWMMMHSRFEHGQSKPLITIGITCFSEGDWLAACWESVLAQTSENWEAVLVLDGGANAETREIFAQIDHPRLKKFSFAENKGPYIVRNKAFELTETPYHFYVDADDRLPTGIIARVVDLIREKQEVDLVYGDVLEVGMSIEVRKLPDKITIQDVVNGIRPSGAMIYRTEFWREMGGFALDGSLQRGMSDLDFLIGALGKKARIVHCQQLAYIKRTSNTGQVSRSYKDSIYHKAEVIVERHPDMFADPNILNGFLGERYLNGARYYARNNQYSRALELALLASQYGYPQMYGRLVRNWRYRKPSGFIALGEIIIKFWDGLIRQRREFSRAYRRYQKRSLQQKIAQRKRMAQKTANLEKKKARSLFVFGCQRSGTNMVARTLGMFDEVEFFNEDSPLAFQNCELISDAHLRRLFERSYASVVLFKPIMETYQADRLLTLLTNSKGMFIYRHYFDVVNSIARSKNVVEAIVRRFDDFLATASPDTQMLVSSLLNYVSSKESYYALFWYIQTSFYFELDLDTRANVKLINYETIVGSPHQSFIEICEFAGIKYDPSLIGAVHKKSIGKHSPAPIAEPIKSACDKLYQRLEAKLGRV